MSSKRFSISKAIIRGDEYVPLVDPEEDDEDAPLDEQREDTDDQRDVSYAPLRSITPPIDDSVMPTLYHSHAVVRREEEVEVDVDEDAHSRSRSHLDLLLLLIPLPQKGERENVICLWMRDTS